MVKDLPRREEATGMLVEPSIGLMKARWGFCLCYLLSKYDRRPVSLRQGRYSCKVQKFRPPLRV